MKRITIIGGGASGILTAANLIRFAGERSVSIHLVERRSRVGRGVAFGTSHETHLLNVPSGRMGAFPDKVGDFYDWLQARKLNYGPNAFVPRRIFGDYLRSVFETTAAEMPGNVTFEPHDDEAVEMTADDGEAYVILRSGEIIRSDKVVLAFGNFAPPDPSVPDRSFVDSPHYFKDPWGSDLYGSLQPDADVLVIGTGLSMVDVAVQMNAIGHRGTLFALSTRGLLPTTHELGHSYEPFHDELAGCQRITEMLKIVRRHIENAAASGSDWRAVIDSLRPITQRSWQQLPHSEKRYFKQHLSRYWNVARHRMPPEAAAVLNEMRSTGRLKVLAGRLDSIEHDGSKFITQHASNGLSAIVESDILINCIGSQTNFAKVDSELVRNLIAHRHIRNDDLDFGIDASADGRVVGKDDKHSDVVWTLGTALRGRLWETTAIPEIRSQAHELALQLLEN